METTQRKNTGFTPLEKATDEIGGGNIDTAGGLMPPSAQTVRERSSLTGFTPMMRQYLDIKKDYPDAILFFRLGDFYEMFFEDAKTASSILGLTLTSREAGKNNRVPMCGIPYHAADNYISRLIRNSKKIAICEQVEDPKAAKGIVKRKIIRVVTPGTLVGENILGEPNNNYLAAVYQEVDGAFGLAVADLSTGEFNVAEITASQQLLSELTRLNPAELLFNSRLRENGGFAEKIKLYTNSIISSVDEWVFGFSAGYEKLVSHFRTRNLRGFGCEEMQLAIPAAGALLHYLEETQKTKPVHIKKIKPYFLNKIMMVDGIAQRNLELVRPVAGSRKTTLLKTIDFTNTPMGRRLIVQWIQKPLMNVSEINERLDAVEELSGNQTGFNKICDVLREIADIERIVSRVSLGAANARDLYSLNESLKLIPRIKGYLKEIRSRILISVKEGLNECLEIVNLIDDSIRSDAPVSVKEGGMIKKGFNKQLDELLDVTRGGRQWIAALQQEEIRRTGISSLKVKYNRVFGYYIEITKANLHLVPDDYTRKQTLVGAERFITPALKEQEDKILSAEEKVIELEYEIFRKVCEKIIDNLEVIQKNAQLIAALDVLNSFAGASARNGYSRPQLNEDAEIKIIDGRHPVLENILPAGKFIPNDTLLDNSENQILIITGPNMAGKSTYIRSVALIILMAQAGCFVPAKEARIGIVDKIFTRVGASDDIGAGMSTFMMEMSETANILNNVTARSLVVLDEIGRGTSTFDGLSIAWAVAEYLHKDMIGKPRTLFATHYHELAELEMTLSGIKNYNVAVREWNDEVTFLYKLRRGFADHSYGIHVGRLAGLPDEVIIRAKEILNNLEINPVRKARFLSGRDEYAENEFSNGASDGIPSLAKPDENKGHKDEIQAEFFAENKNPVLEEIKNADINNITPLAALDLIDKWRKKLQDEEK